MRFSRKKIINMMMDQYQMANIIIIAKTRRTNLVEKVYTELKKQALSESIKLNFVNSYYEEGDKEGILDYKALNVIEIYPSEVIDKFALECFINEALEMNYRILLVVINNREEDKAESLKILIESLDIPVILFKVSEDKIREQYQRIDTLYV